MEQTLQHREQSLPPVEGIEPGLLYEQVLNTAAFILEPQFTFDPSKSPFLQWMRDFSRKAPAALSLSEIFFHNLSAHYTTVATFVPTDVDLHIRFKLWKRALQEDKRSGSQHRQKMTEAVLNFLHADVTPVSRRYVQDPTNGEVLPGHQGEWFSVAVAAYAAALAAGDAALAEHLAEVIFLEVERHKKVFKNILKSKDGVKILVAATIQAHNLGDLDRVFDAWNISDQDALKKRVYKKGHYPETGTVIATQLPILGLAGYLNKQIMAKENHRHYPLRNARSLRRSADYLMTTAPFFDEWGRRIMLHPQMTDEDLTSVISTLLEGWIFLNQKVTKPEFAVEGYARALVGMERAATSRFSMLAQELPAKMQKLLKSGDLKGQLDVSKEAFESRLSRRALKLIS